MAQSSPLPLIFLLLVTVERDSASRLGRILTWVLIRGPFAWETRVAFLKPDFCSLLEQFNGLQLQITEPPSRGGNKMCPTRGILEALAAAWNAILQLLTGSSNLFDLEDAVYESLVENASEDEKLVTFDITGDNLTRGLKAGEAMDTHPPVTITAGPVRYRKPQVQSLQLSAVYVQTFHNNQTRVEGTAQISEQVEHEDEYMWTVTKGLEFTTKVKFSITVPLVYQLNSEVSTSVKTTSGSTTVETRTTRQLIKQDIKIPPGATIEARWYVNEAQVVVPWESEITLDGIVAALYEKPDGGLTWKYFNMSVIKHDKLKVSGTSVLFLASGLFQANVARSYHLSTSQKELTQHSARLAKYIMEKES